MSMTVEESSAQQPDSLDRRRDLRGRTIGALETYGMVGLTILVIVFFSLLPATQNFLTIANLQVTLGNQSVIVLVAFAALVPIVAGLYDFSVGAVTGLCSVYAASIFASGGSTPVAFAVAIGIGVAIGLCNGLIVTRLRVNSLVTTIGTSTIIAGIVQWKTGGIAIISGVPAGIGSFGSSTFLDLPLPTYVAVGGAIVMWYLLRLTPYGRYLYAIGSNRRAAVLVGINTRRLELISFVLAGLIASLAGLLELTITGSGNPVVGPGFTLPAFAVVFLGTAAIRPGQFNVGGLLVAVVFLAALNSGLILAGASSYVSDLANGCALIVGVALARALRKTSEST